MSVVRIYVVYVRGDGGNAVELAYYNNRGEKFAGRQTYTEVVKVRGVGEKKKDKIFDQRVCLCAC